MKPIKTVHHYFGIALYTFCMLALLVTAYKVGKRNTPEPIKTVVHDTIHHNSRYIPSGSYTGLDVKITVYQATEAQCDDTPLLTASGAKIDVNAFPRWIAISQDLKGLINFGDTVYIDSKYEWFSGWYVVQDVMNKRAKKTVDILMPKWATGDCFRGTLLFIPK